MNDTAVISLSVGREISGDVQILSIWTVCSGARPTNTILIEI